MLLFALPGTLLVAGFPVFFLWLANAAEVGLADITTSLLLLWGVGLGAFGAAWALLRSAALGGLLAALFSLAFAHFFWLRQGIGALLPGLRYYHIYIILLFLFIFVGLAFKAWLSPRVAHRINQGLCVGFGALLVVNLVTAAPALAAKAGGDAPEAEAIQTGAATGDRPNIYYFILDEYSSNYAMEKYFGYDNTPFTGALQEMGFSVSATSRNEFPSTPMVTANLMALDYLATPATTESEWDELRDNSRLFETLRGAGYILTGVGETAYFGLESETTESEGGATTLEGEGFAQLMLERTPLAPFVVQNTAAATAGVVHDAFGWYTEPANYQTDDPRLTFLYLMTPHCPYIFDENGNYVDTMHWKNFDDPQYYLGQFIYITELWRQAVEGILQNDPDSIIILQSDHGIRYLGGRLDSVVTTADMSRIFNAVYYRGEEIDVEGLSGVNTLRLVLQKLLDIELPALEVPYYGPAEE